MANLMTEDRERWILSTLSEYGSISLSSASKSLGVSEQTVRRDIISLERQGLARRVRGGAQSTAPVSFRGREAKNAEQKRLIAAKLLPLVPRQGVIAIDSSSTMSFLASMIRDATDLTVVTNGVQTMRALQDKPGIEALLLGGKLDSRGDSLVGPLAARCASGFGYSIFFASQAGLHRLRGGFDDTLEEAHIKQTFAECSAQVAVGVDASKLDQLSLAQSLETSAIQTLATDLDPGHRALDGMRKVISGVI